jgi:hypothetical protein
MHKNFAPNLAHCEHTFRTSVDTGSREFAPPIVET